MNRNEFIALLKENGIPQGIVSLIAVQTMAITYEKTNYAGKRSQGRGEKSMIASDFLRKAMHCSICLMNSSLYTQGISQILKGVRSTPVITIPINSALDMCQQ